MAAFERLVGTWEVTGGVIGQVSFAWLPGGYFLVQTVRMIDHGRVLEGIDIIGHTRPWRGAPSNDVVSRFYDSDGNTLDYVYELSGDRLTIWSGHRGSDLYYEGFFNDDGTEIHGRRHFPASEGYSSVMRKVSES